MEFFEFIWSLLEKHGSVAWKYKDDAMREWAKYNVVEKRYIYAAIKKKLAAGYFVSYLPHKAIDENAPRSSKNKQLSYNDYYTKYGTTEELDGWKKIYLPNEQKTIYIKN